MTKMKLQEITEQNILPYYFTSINNRGNLVKIEIRTIQPDDAEELYEFARSMARIFATSEPMTIAAGITEEEFFQEIYLYLQSAKNEGLSLILKNEETGKIIGGIIGRDFYNDEAEDPYVELAHKEKFQQVTDVINLSRKKFRDILQNDGFTLKPGLAYRITYLGFFGKYIILNDKDGFNLTALSFRKFEEYLKSLGYKYLYGEATNPGSQKLILDLGWTIDQIIIPYTNYSIFKNIDFHKHALEGIGNSLCGSILKLNKAFTPLRKAVDRRVRLAKN